jgi:putative FmdB family regulatory protein
MPQYTFYCEPCSLQFKRRLAMGDHPEHKCPSCKGLAGRRWDGQSLSHSFAASAGTALANSGVSQHDYPTADNIVGRSAEMRWAEQHKRNAAKAQIRDQGVALARKDTSEGGERVSEYQALGQAQFEARKKLEGKFRTEAKTRGMSDPLGKS